MPTVSLVAVSGYAVAAVAHALMFALIVPLRPHTRFSRWLLAATAASAVWALLLLGSIWRPDALAEWVMALDTAHLATWVLFVVALIGFSGVVPSGSMGKAVRSIVLAGAIAAIVLNLPPIGGALAPEPRFLAVLVLSLAGLLGIEQIFRNATFEEQRFLKPLAIGIGGIFAIDIFVYAQALLFGAVGSLAWSLRGFANALVVPLLLIAAKRQPNWGETLFVSRHIVYYSTTLTAVGLYLIAMAAGGYVIGASNLAWGTALQALFLVLAGAVLVVVLFSQALRNRLRVFIAKHFYRNRYDYREEWLRLMHTLVGGSDEHALPRRSVKALAEIIGSPRGELWLLGRDKSRFEPYGSWQADMPANGLSEDDAVIKFLRDTRWVVDTDEYRRNPERYANALAATDYLHAAPSIYVPLMHNGALVGVARLDRPQGIGDLSFEDHDLLKTAAQQAAIFLIQERDQEELSETRQFEAFSRLTAFLMHDLKNMIAQQELVVGNAKRFKHRPEFIDDAIRTIDGSVRRMRSVLERLQSAGRRDYAARVDLIKVVGDTAAACSDRDPKPTTDLCGEAVWISIDRDKLVMAITHAIRNAQDATDAAGRIEIRVSSRGGRAVIEVEDDGLGMDQEFIRNHLFKPFESTKGAKGMGIGAYQIRETVRAAGGDLEVQSERAKGTKLILLLPMAPAPEVPAGPSPA